MPQSRKWLLTINNPADHDLGHDNLIEAIESLAAVVYWCMCDEIGHEGTHHTHLYIAFKNPKLHTVIANAFPGAHRDIARGTSQHNRDYVLKDGEKFNKQPDGTYDYVDNSGKRHQGTNLTDTFREWGELTNKNLWLKSRRKTRPYKQIRKAARPPKGLSIEQRPREIQTRTTPGHWEMDTVIGTSKGKKQALLVLTERNTRHELIYHLPDKTAKSVVRTLDKAIRKYPSGAFQTITVDNGSEFQDCFGMEHDKHGNKRLTVYYCHPYSSWERGSNENANKIIRRFYPKGQSLAKVTQKHCDQVTDFMNNLPRKMLDYATPAELFEQFIQSLT